MIRYAVTLYVRYPLSLRNVEDLLHESGIEICHETVRHWWMRFGPMFASEIRRKRVQVMRQHTHRRWHLDEVYMRIRGDMRYLWRAVDHEGEVLESFVTKGHTIIFLRSATSSTGRPTRTDAQPHWPSGGRSRPDADRGRGACAPAQTGRVFV